MSKIITSTEFSSYMKPTVIVDSLAQQIVSGVNGWVENYTNRCFGCTKTVTERYDWAPEIWLRHQDVSTEEASMTIKLGYPHLQQSQLDNTSFFWNEWGRVTMYLQQPNEFNPSAVNNDLVEITYTYGLVEVPDDLKLATLGIAGDFYNWAVNGQKDVVATSVGTYRLEFIGATRSQTPKTNPALVKAQANWNVIESYRMQRV